MSAYVYDIKESCFLPKKSFPVPPNFISVNGPAHENSYQDSDANKQ